CTCCGRVGSRRFQSPSSLTMKGSLFIFIVVLLVMLGFVWDYLNIIVDSLEKVIFICIYQKLYVSLRLEK
ncbi:MAG: hypothetical protein ACI4BD_06275, partial [Paludibacteraceae bacterium]